MTPISFKNDINPMLLEEQLHSIQLAEDDILAGRLISLEEMKTRHPHL